jgi:hypothetical protein
MLSSVPDGNGGWADPGMAVDLPPDIKGAVTFVALDPVLIAARIEGAVRQ